MESSSRLPKSTVENPPLFLTKELGDIERWIDHLRTELLAAENRRDAIEREIALSTQSRVGIHRAPPEILCEIFLLVDDEQGVRNHRISLVCKAWQALIGGTSSMWTQICVEWTGSIKGIINSWKYIDVCLKKSRYSSLDITVDLSEQPSYEDYLDQVLHDHFKLLGPQWLPCLPSEHLETTDESMAEYHYGRLAETTLCNLGRDAPWRSLRLSLSAFTWIELDMIDDLFIHFHRVTEFEYHGGQAQELTLAEFRQLKRLKTDRSPWLLNECPSLSELELVGTDATFDFLNDGDSPAFLLESLTLDATNIERKLVSNTTISLPLLQSLSIHGDAAYALKFIEATRLRALHLDVNVFDRFEDTPILYRITDLTLEVFRLSLGVTDALPFMEYFKSILPHCKDLTQVTIICYSSLYKVLPPLVTALISDLRDAGTPLSALATIRIEEMGSSNLRDAEEIRFLPADI